MTTAIFRPRPFHDALRTDSIGRFLLYRTTVETTMTLAAREAGEGAPHGTLVLAEEQTAGRGRRGRSFYSPPGDNLYFTLVLRLDPDATARLPLALPLAAASACRDATGLPSLGIKWPNDLWVGERKVCGMLIDAASGPAGTVAMPGVGINVNGDPTRNPDLAAIATSLERETGAPVSREPLLAALCNELEANLVAPVEALRDTYRQLSLVLGRRVHVTGAGLDIEGTADDIDPAGALLVRTDAGHTERLMAGDVTLRPL